MENKQGKEEHFLSVEISTKESGLIQGDMEKESCTMQTEMWKNIVTRMEIEFNDFVFL